MYSFSLTAPRITEEQFQKEHQDLDSAEAAALERDLYGTVKGSSEPDWMISHESETTRVHGLEQLEAAIDMLAPVVKEDYLHALATAPDLVERETNPVEFLRIEEYDPWKAAKRLTSYWTLRRKAFGEHRAFLPMDDTTGDGALSEKALQGLKRGVWTPSPKKDEHGRYVLYYDRPKINQLTRECMTQITIYAFTILGARDKERPKGVILIVNGTTNRIDINRKTAKDVTFFFGECSPIPVRCLHAFLPFMHPPFNLMLPVIRAILGKHLRRRLILHYGCTAKMIHSASQYGITADLIPECFGGDWDPK